MAIDMGEDLVTRSNKTEGGGPSLSETILAMDIADTIRHDDRLREFEMADGDRRKAMMERLRQAYAAQGDIVSDDVLERAIAKMHEDRYVHRQQVRGLSGLLWKSYIRRGAYSLRAAMAAAVVVSLFFGYDQFVAKPQIEAERRLAMEIGEIIPRDLAASVTYAKGFAARLGDEAALARIDARASAVETALLAKDIKAARSGIGLITAVGDELKHREEAQAQAAAQAEREKLELQRRAEVSARLLPQLAKVTAGPLAEVKDAKAKAALFDISVRMRDAANDGDEGAYNEAYDRFKSFAGYIRSPYKLQIVNRSGMQTGFARQINGTKTWYIVVEAVSPSGVPYPLEIKDRIMGTTKTTATWAIRVSESVIHAVKRDKEDDGILDRNIAGTKAADTLDIVWNFDAFDGQTLNTW